MYSVNGIFSLFLLPAAVVKRKFPIVFKPPIEAGVICSMEPVDAIKILLTISVCFLFEYLTTKAFMLLSDVGKKRALFLILLKISFSFCFGIISSKLSKNVLLLKVSRFESLIIICLHFVVFALNFRAVWVESFLDKLSTTSKTSNSSNFNLFKQFSLII